MIDDHTMTGVERRRTLAAVIACIAIYGITSGLTLPLLSLILESREVDRTLIGFNAAMPALAMLVVSPLIPRTAHRLGMKPFLFACIAGELALFLVLPVFDHLYAWFAIRFLMGATMAGLFIVSETWINEIATERTRGRVMATYAATMSASFALGPVIVPLTGIEGWPPFLAGGACIAAAALPLWLTGNNVPSLHGDASFGVVSFLAVAPVLAAAVLLAAFKESAGMALLPVFGVRSGLGEGTAALMLTALGLGGVLFQIPIGLLADRYNRHRILMLCATGGAIGAASLPWVATGGAALWIMLFCWGGVFAGVYTVAMVLVGERFRGAELATANAAFGVLWGVGSLAGPAVAGFAMDGWDPHGLPAVLAVASAAFVALALRFSSGCAPGRRLR